MDNPAFETQALVKDINTGGCCIEPHAWPGWSAPPAAPSVLSFKVNGQVPSTTLDCKIVGINDHRHVFHIRFEQPHTCGRRGALATTQLASPDLDRSEAAMEFVGKEIDNRTKRIIHRMDALLGVARLYVLGLTALATYLGLGFSLIDSTVDSRFFFAVVGICFIFMMVALGLFLLRFAGYMFSANIINRKRIVLARTRFADALGLTSILPPPRDPSQVFIMGGYRWFPYLFAAINLCLLILIAPLLWVTTKDILTSIVVATSVILIAAMPYPLVCHRYWADIIDAKHFATVQKDFPDLDTTDPAQLKDLYHKRLQNKEHASRKHQWPLLWIYALTTFATIGWGCVILLRDSQDWVSWLPYMALGIIAVALRGLTINYRWARPGQ
jgi:hypothetical protein